MRYPTPTFSNDTAPSTYPEQSSAKKRKRQSLNDDSATKKCKFIGSTKENRPPRGIATPVSTTTSPKSRRVTSSCIQTDSNLYSGQEKVLSDITTEFRTEPVFSFTFQENLQQVVTAPQAAVDSDDENDADVEGLGLDNDLPCPGGRFLSTPTAEAESRLTTPPSLPQSHEINSPSPYLSSIPSDALRIRPMPCLSHTTKALLTHLENKHPKTV